MEFIPASFILQTILTGIIGSIATVLSIYQIHNKTLKHITTVAVLSFTIFLILVIVKTEQKEQDEFNELANDVRSALAFENLDTEEIIAKLAAAHKDIFQLSQEETKKWADEFEKSLPEKKAKRELMESTEHQLAQKLEIQWKPLYDYVLSTFDNAALELKKKNLVTYYEKSDDPQFIHFQNYTQQEPNVRLITFPNKRTLYVKVKPAIIRDGKLERGLAILFMAYSGGTNPLVISFDDSLFKFSALDFPGMDTIKDPLLDQEFRTQLTSYIHGTIERAYLEKSVTP